MALAPLLVALAGWPPASQKAASITLRPPAPRRAFALGLLTGLVYFGGTLYWISQVMVRYGGLTFPVAVAVDGLLVAYLALFPAVFALLTASLVGRLGSAALLLSPAVWVTTELARAHLFSGFPWVLLGYSQATVLPIAQLASVTGVYGLSALVGLVSAAFAFVVFQRGRIGVAAVVVTAACVTSVAVWGVMRLSANVLAGNGTPIRIALVQGSIEQSEKWDPALADWILDRYVRLTRQAAARGARFVVWPESSTPFFLEEHPGGEIIRRMVRDTGVFLLVGSDQLERGTPPRYYNAAFLLGPDGRTLGVYRKMHLVPFGEYVPLRKLLFFVAPLVEAVADFSPGDEAATFEVGGGIAMTAICYEVVYPDLVRQFVLRGTELLTTITNDAWYGRSSGPYQHFEQATVRAIENGRYLARAANTGISAIVDPYGRVLTRSGLFEPVLLVGEVRFLKDRTIYTAIGDAFAYTCVALTLAALAAGVRAARLHRRRETRDTR